MVNSDSIADVALVISVVALLVTSAQLLSQIFATAEGHRRCQPSVIGDWAKLTRRKWRWTSFRFETIVTTPEIRLRPLKIYSRRAIDDRSAIDVYDTLSNFEIHTSNDELVCWIPLLDTIGKSMRSNKRASYLEGARYYCSMGREIGQTLPVLRHKSRSWDFMPPEVVRPFASTTVSDIAILALRIGMSWKVLKPEEGVMEAEGNGHGLSSTLIRSLGTLVRYVGSFESNFEVNPLFKSQGYRGKAETFIVETAGADRMWFGILPLTHDFGLGHGFLPRLVRPSARAFADRNALDLSTGTGWDIFIGNSQSVYDLMDWIDPSLEATNALKRTAPSLFGFNDIIPMLAPWMRQKDTFVNTLPSVTYDVRGITHHEASQNVFYTRLKQYIQESEGSRYSSNVEDILIAWNFLLEHYPEEWRGLKGPREGRTTNFLDALEENYDKTTSLLDGYDSGLGVSGDYFVLVKAHLTRAALVKGRAEEAVRKPDYKSPVTLGPAWVAEAMNIYWDDLETLQAAMREIGYSSNVARVKEMWIISMFRAFLWSRAHEFDNRQNPLPSKYYGSHLPV